METNYSVEGSNLFQHKAADLKIAPVIPAGVWNIRLHPQRGYYLEQADSFAIPKKLYGTVARDSDRILTTFHNRQGSTGVLLAGDAGSGKTMLAKKVAVDASGRFDMPTVVVNTEFFGAPFNAFIQGIQQDAVILFDEFEKIYSPEAQTEVLTLLDGTVRTKKLFIFTCNDKWRVNEHMQNRPGRIFYFKDYAGLGEAFIREYLNDKLNEHLKVHIDSVVQFASTFRSFNFDILQAVCEEMNRYNEAPKEALAMLNARPGFNRVDTKYNMVLESPDGQRLTLPRQFTGTPLMLDGNDINVQFYRDEDSGKISLSYQELTGIDRFGKPIRGAKVKNRDDINVDEKYLSFEEDHMEGPQPDGSILFENAEGYKLFLTKGKEKSPDELRFLAA